MVVGAQLGLPGIAGDSGHAPRHTSFVESPLVSEQRATQPRNHLLRLSAAAVLRMLAPKCNASVFGRLVNERVRTAADLASLDKNDLRDLGLTMVDRGRVLRWARENQVAASPGSSTGRSCDTSPGTPGYGFGMELCSRAQTRQAPVATPENAQTPNGDPEEWAARAVHIAEEEEEANAHLQLDAIEQQADFWCALAAAAPPLFRRQPRLKSLADVRETVLEEWFDVTSERVSEVYSDMFKASLDPAGGISVHELGEGLRRCGLAGLDDAALACVMEAVKPRRNGKLRLAEFETILSRLKLGQLFATPPGVANKDRIGTSPCAVGSPAVHLSVVDYNSHQCITREITCARFREFCFGHRSRPQHRNETPLVRWAHLTEFNLTALLCLTVKYSLHPLGVEDVIEQCPTKIDRYGCNYFAAVEQLCLVGDPATYSGGQLPVRVVGLHVAAFCSGPPLFDTVLTIAQPDRSFANEWPGASDPCLVSRCWEERLRQRLTSAPRSRLRERRADFILYQVLDLTTDELQAVIHAYTMRLGHLESHVGSVGEKAPGASDEVSMCRLQLKVVMRRVRGMQRLLRHFKGHPEFSADLSGYLQDVVEHLDEAYEDAAQLVEKCTAIIEAHHRAADQRDAKVHQRTADRVNKTLSVLTVGTFIFAPMQFLASVYGMNFTNEAGEPTIPELLWKNGYPFFWMAIIGYLVLMSCFTTWWYYRIHRRSAEDAGADDPGRADSCIV